MVNKTVNWETYLQDFPDRYTKLGRFDVFAEEVIDGVVIRKPSPDVRKPKITALDVGGGKNGSNVLRHSSVTAWIADPYIKTCPKWMNANLGDVRTIDSSLKFDFIVARGVFNYLKPTEIRTIHKLLNPGGEFVFNTFVSPSTGERPYINCKSGKKGIEKYSHEGDVIRHQLIPDDGGDIIEHHFLVYDEKMIRHLLSDFCGWVSYLTHGNSLYVRATRPDILDTVDY